MTKNTCIIGAGSSGITVAKALLEQGIAFDCFEKGSGIDGNWRYNNDNQMSSAYRTLHINTSRDIMAYSDYPMPKDLPDFPSHSQILQYFEDYVDEFGIRKHITFKTGVASVVENVNGGYTVKTEDGQERRYENVIVGNGHHWDPRYPSPKFEGEYTGEIMHSHFYKTPERFADKKVLVLGIGNSGCDISCELSKIAAKVTLATRSGAHVIPKYILGKPLDANSESLKNIPIGIQRRIFKFILKITRGNVEDYGLPTPKGRLFEEHPTVSNDLLNLIGHGRIHVKPNIQKYSGKTVFFEDGSSEEFDIIIYATGYKITFPFFDEAFIVAKDNKISLYHHVVHPEKAGLYFVGLIQPLGAIMPLTEIQGKWIAGLIKGTIKKPTKEVMLKTINGYVKKLRKRYSDKPRHTIQVDFWPYRMLIEKEMKKMRV